MGESLLEELKRYVGFGSADARALVGLHPHARQHFERIAEVFYGRILDHPDARRALEGGENQVGHLKKTLVEWMDSLMLGPWDDAYFERRCRIGHMHVRIRLPQHYMFGAMNLVRGELSMVVENARTADHEVVVAERAALDRILDIELAIMLHSYREDLDAQRMAAVSTLTAGLAHEIRNPLNAAGLQLAVLERRLRRTPVAGQAALLGPLVLVRDEIRRLDLLLEDLLQYTRPRKLQRRAVEVTSLVERVADLLSSDADARGVALSRAVESGLLVSGDEARLREVVMNLMLNALEASQRGGEVRVGARRLGPSEVELWVEDDGAGVKPELREQVFQPFFTTKAKGGGLGLAIVHAIVTQHGGSVRLESSAKGGAAVRVRLPAG